MNIYQAKQIQLKDFLKELGHEPVKAKKKSLWYLSPLREERTPSFSVEIYKNVWFDHGIGQGGNIIDLAKHLYHTQDLSTLLRKIESLDIPVAPQKYDVQLHGNDKQESFQRVDFVNLNHHLLIDYLISRSVDYHLAAVICKEVHYYYKGRPYYAIAFPNNKGGYEIRNRLFKGCIAPKDITLFTVEGSSATTVCVFEGFMDYLSYLTLSYQNPQMINICSYADMIILNSVALVSKALPLLSKYEAINCYLDNDKAGRATFETIKGAFEDKAVFDWSSEYSDYNDLNSFLMKHLKIIL